MKSAALFLLILLPSLYFAWNHSDMPQFGRHHDDTIYFESAKSLAQGAGYRLHSYPGDPAMTKYPPGYPWMLAAVWAVFPEFPDNMRAVTWLSWFMMVPFVWLTRAVLLQFGIRPALAWLLTAWIGWNALTIALSISVMSDLPFAVLLLAVIWRLERWRESRPAIAALGALAGATFLLRSMALPLIATAPLILWWQGKRRQALLFAGAMSPFVAAWQWWAKAHQIPTTDSILLYYTSYIGFHLKHVGWHNLIELVWTNFNGFVSRVGQMLVFYPDDSFLPTQMFRLITVASIAGIIRLVRQSGRWHYALFGVGLSSMLLLWTYPPIPRFIFPLLPLFAAGFGVELDHIVHMIRDSWKKPKLEEKVAVVVFGSVLGVFLLFAALTTYAGVTHLVPDMIREDVRFKPYRSEAYEWIKANTAASDVVLAYDDVLLHLYTGRRSFNAILPPQVSVTNETSALEREVAGTSNLMRARGSRWVLWTEKDFSRDWPSAEALKELYDGMPELKCVWDSGHAAVYTLK